MPRLRFVSTVQGTSTIELNEPIITVGRVANNVVCIEDPNISKHHTLLVSEDDTYKIYDLHSVNGTWVNAERITVTRLKDGDAVRIGYLELKYESGLPVVGTAPGPSKTATGPTLLTTRPRIGLKAPGPVVTPGAAPAPAPGPVTLPVAPPAQPPPIPTSPSLPAPVKDEPRQSIQLPTVKKSTGPTPTVPPPVPVPTMPGEPVAPPAGPKKLGGIPGGGPGKFKLKRE